MPNTIYQIIFLPPHEKQSVQVGAGIRALGDDGPDPRAVQISKMDVIRRK
jgi:hypothetical protein